MYRVVAVEERGKLCARCEVGDCGNYCRYVEEGERARRAEYEQESFRNARGFLVYAGEDYKRKQGAAQRYKHIIADEGVGRGCGCGE